MAVLPSCPGLKVEVIVNGEPITEYDDNEADQPNELGANATSTYIEAASGAKYAIRVTFSDGFQRKYTVKAAAHIDGVLVHAVIMQKKHLLEHVRDLSAKSERRAGRWSQSDFQFSEIIPGEINLRKWST
jgi:hypothetical protein